MGIGVAVAGGAMIVTGVILVVVGKRKAAMKETISATPTKPIARLMQSDHAEINGVVACDQPLTAPYSDISCVYYSYKLEERRRHRSGGRTTTSWRTIDSGVASMPFTVTDSSGSVTVNPEGAKMDAPVVVKGPVPAGDVTAQIPEGLPKMLLSLASKFGSLPRRVKVRAIGTGQSLYVLGDVRRTPDGRTEIAEGDNKFFVSTKSEEQLLKSLGRISTVLYVLGVSFIGGAIALFILKSQ